MGRLRRRQLPDGPLANFFDALLDLHRRAGEPSIRDIARQIQTLSHDTVHRTLTGPTLPRWASVEMVVQALGGDVDSIKSVWLAARTREDEGSPVSDDHLVETRVQSEQSPIPAGGDLPDPGQIRVMIVEDHPLFRYGLQMVLESVGLTVVASVEDGAEAVRIAAEARPDVVIMDLHLPVMSGIEATAHLIRQNPSIRVLVLSMFSDADEVVRAFQAGATGYLLKGAGQEEIVNAIRRTALGESVISPHVASSMLAHYREVTAQPDDAPPVLTKREREVIRLVADGSTNRDIAEALGISRKTVETMLMRIFRKLELNSRVGLTRYAIEHHLTGDS
jgi:DNA-binding NarL/FixJ family response regulator